MNEREPVIVSAVRTPIGSFGGSLRDVLHERLAATVMEEVCNRVSFPKKELDDVYWGAAMVRSDKNGGLTIAHQIMELIRKGAGTDPIGQGIQCLSGKLTDDIFFAGSQFDAFSVN